ncbi:MAG: hypothetical protein ABGX39_01640 [Methylococcales bacterium]
MIQDIDEMKTKMSVINSTIPVYIDPDVLWSLTEDSSVIMMLQKITAYCQMSSLREKWAVTVFSNSHHCG